MKTYTKTEIVTKQRLKIHYDSNAESPREWSNLGHFITVESRHQCPDENSPFLQIVKDAQHCDNVVDTETHVKAIIKLAGEQGHKVIHIVPVNRYEHGDVIYRQGTGSGFDTSNSGFYIVTEESQKVVGVETEDFEKVIDAELALYTQWANGEVYWFESFDEEGASEDNCGGFFDIDDIKDYLGEEWENEDMSDYLITE